ncbi:MULTISPECIES: hypothetical protein [Chryseobacterium]|uniref:Uncharacterized protein n=1 Tax=Chryseobacterium candidae TaxID=1978493 RepID=A0ABY2R6Y6_9FLAO|nr:MULTISPECIES: hypothetical protein [Chryseobacterium]PXW16564.1 hypothetical protein C8D70_10361 [Chryseobacterium sp. CBTAP 102]THV59895.1 hypothetical protein EK417_10625 [Chryseobacterium candidae]
MRKNLLLAGLFTTFSLVVKSQVGINTSNPQGVFNIDGLKNNPTTGVPNAVQAKDDLVMISNGNLGLGLTAPGTTLDVNGAITNRETALAVAGNAVTIPVNVSQVQLTGAATATVAISAFAAPNPGQRLIVYNNTTGGFGATLDGVTIPNGKALEFVFSNSFWRSTDGGAAGASPTNIYTADGTLAGNRTVTQGANTLTFTGTQTNAFSVDGTTLSVDAANNRLGIGTTTPSSKLHVEGSQLLNAAVTTAQTKNALDINVGQDGFGYGNRTDNFGINMKSSSSVFTGPISRINFGDVSTTTATGDRYLSFSVGRIPNELMYLTDANSGRIGIGTSTPQRALHVNGALQVTNEINVGGNGTTAGSAGTSGQILTSGGAGAAPTWQTLNTISGTINGAYYVQGTTAATAAQGTTIDVPGATITLTVPAGRTQTFLFTVLGYATLVDGNSSQGVFALVQNGTKISSAFASKAGSFPGGTALGSMPVPVTFLKSVTLTAGTYTFKVQYSAWFGSATVNFVPSGYGGYNGDTESMLTKMQILVYNN